MILFARIILLILYYLDGLHSVTWLGLQRYARHKSNELEPFNYHECQYSWYNFGLRRRQMRFCYHPSNKYVMHAVVKSAQAVAAYCPQIFKDSRWNCSNIQYLPNVSPELKRGTKEQAIVYAMASGALLFEISRRCAMDRIANCPCGKDSWSVFEPEDEVKAQRVMFKSPQNKFTMHKNEQILPDPSDQYVWNGCADNVYAARYFSNSFLGYQKMKNSLIKENERLRRRRRILGQQQHRSRIWRRDILIEYNSTMPSEEDIVRALNGHNYAVGIQIMENNRRVTCKCHGLSGSCTQKVCFRQLLRLDDRFLQEKFKQHYLESKYVRYDKNSGGRFVVNNFHKNGEYSMKPVGEADLAYITASSDYCDANLALGSHGTHNRLCAKYSKETIRDFDACQNLCCNRGTYKQLIPKKVPCNCRMTQDFQVKCEECTENEILFYCR